MQDAQAQSCAQHQRPVRGRGLIASPAGPPNEPPSLLLVFQWKKPSPTGPLNKAPFWRGHQILIQSPYNWRPSISTRRVSPTSFSPFLWSARSIPNRRRSTRLAAAAAIPLAVAGDPLPPPVESPPWPDPSLWGTDCWLGAETATGRAGLGRHRA